MKDEASRNDARISLIVPARVANAVKRAAQDIPISMNSYVRIALHDKLKHDGIATDAA
jgi:predicted HicB family RNase H-like nuclease